MLVVVVVLMVVVVVVVERMFDLIDTHVVTIKVDSDMLDDLDNTAVLCFKLWLPAKTCFPPQHLKRF